MVIPFFSKVLCLNFKGNFCWERVAIGLGWFYFVE
jgi:hypothetical protein